MAKTTAPDSSSSDEVEYESWYWYGKVALYLEMLIAILVTGFALYMAFTGSGGVLA